MQFNRIEALKILSIPNIYPYIFSTPKHEPQPQSSTKISTRIKLNWIGFENSIKNWKPKLPDQREGIPDIDAAVDEASSDKAEPELLARRIGGPGPREPVEPLGARRLSDDGEFAIIGLEIELEDLEAGRGAERQIHCSGHRPRCQVRRVRRKRHRRRSVHALYARHGSARKNTNLDLAREREN